jgi:hypothetical protein
MQGCANLVSHPLNMFGDVVKGIPHKDFEQHFDAVKSEAGVKVS